MTTPPLGSILLGSTDPDRLRAWYQEAFDVKPNERNGFLTFGSVGILIDGRTDVAATNPEPGRVILNFHVDDARAAVDRLTAAGATWLVELEERAPTGWFATAVDPDGNYLQIIELSPEYLANQ